MSSFGLSFLQYISYDAFYNRMIVPEGSPKMTVFVFILYTSRWNFYSLLLTPFHKFSVLFQAFHQCVGYSTVVVNYYYQGSEKCNNFKAINEYHCFWMCVRQCTLCNTECIHLFTLKVNNQWFTFFTYYGILIGWICSIEVLGKEFFEGGVRLHGCEGIQLWGYLEYWVAFAKPEKNCEM